MLSWSWYLAECGSQTDGSLCFYLSIGSSVSWDSCLNALHKDLFLLWKMFWDLHIGKKCDFWLHTSDCFSFWLSIFSIWGKSLGLFTGMMGHCLLGIKFVENFLQIFFLLQRFYSSFFFQLSAKTEQRIPSLNWIIRNVLDITVRACAAVALCGKGMGYLRIFDGEHLE